VRGDGGIDEPAEVVVEHLLARDEAVLRLVEDGVVLELILAALDRPHLPVRQALDERLRERREVRGAGRRAGVQHEDVPRLRLAHLEDAHLVQVGRRPRRGVALHPGEADLDVGPSRPDDRRTNDEGEEEPQ
jgi:hypothetical protein